MAVAGHTAVVYVRTDTTAPSSADEIDGVNAADLELMRELLETTDFKDATGGRTRIAGLKDTKLGLSGDLESTDINQGLLRTAFDNGTSVYVTVHFNPGAAAGSKGYRVEFLVASEKPSAKFDGKAECAWSLEGTGAVARV